MSTVNEYSVVQCTVTLSTVPVVEADPPLPIPAIFFALLVK
jgi:hypothetical protein